LIWSSLRAVCERGSHARRPYRVPRTRQQCLELASETHDLRLKESLTDLAHRWMAIATDLEATRDLLAKCRHSLLVSPNAPKQRDKLPGRNFRRSKVVTRSLAAVQSADHYRKQAEDCRRQAEQTTNPEQKAIWLQLVNAYLQLAEHAERENKH
jgi:hypothetical protein